MSQPSRKKAIVTGATGFLGRHLVKRLHTLGWEVHCIVRAESQHHDLIELLNKRQIHVHDGTMNNMMSIVERAAPEIVFHLASLFLPQHTPSDISRLIRSNIEFPAQLAEAMAAHRVPYLINTSTAWQHYQNADYNPVNLYAATKQACVDLLRFYSESAPPTTSFRVINFELFDTYGPSDPRPKLFSALRNAAHTNKPLAMSTGDQLIDLVYMDDVIEAFIAATLHIQQPGRASPTTMETFAVSSGRPLPLKELVALWQKITGQRVHVHWGVRSERPREMMQPWNRGVPLPGWRPRVDIEEGIRHMEGIA
ncbi:MAG: NAD(P)-dependent oxidoreductase [Phycisphaerales bacterium]|nr:NAD(P)-dependent oxidoreductase [Phycisphaerales bacterium]